MANVEYAGNPEATCYYDRLGVSRSTDQDTLTTVGKIAKREVHPDNSSAERKTAEMHFYRVNTAVNILRDAEKRATYDTFIRRFGTETGTKEYEQWVDSDRPVPADSWDSANRATENTTSHRQTNTQHTSTDTDRPTSDDETTTADAEKSAHSTSDGYHTTHSTSNGYHTTHSTSNGYHTTTSETRSASQQHQPNSNTRYGPNTGSSTTTQTESIYTNPTAQEPYSQRGEPSVTFYNSTPPDRTTSTQSGASNTTAHNTVTTEYIARYVPNVVDTVMGWVMSTPLGVIFSSTAPKSLSARIYFVLLSYWILSFFPVSTTVLLVVWYCLFAPFPRIGCWLSGITYVYIVIYYFILQWNYQFMLPEEAVYATFLSIGYYLLIWGSSLDPYASS